MATPAPTISLNLDGSFYPNFIAERNYSPEVLHAIRGTAQQLLIRQKLSF